MKRFILQGIFFLIAFCVTQVICNNLVFKHIGKPFYHNKHFTTKYFNYLSKAAQYNTLFIGSSRIYRQVNPQIIDQGLTNFDIKSYNLGTPATFIPETFYLLDMIIENQAKEKEVKYIFMEMTGITNIKIVNWVAPQSYYYLDADLIQLIFKYNFGNANLHWTKAFQNTFPFVQGFALKQIMPQSLIEPQLEDIIYTGPNRDGYYPLQLEVDQLQNDNLISRRNKFLSDTTVLLRRKETQFRWKKENLAGAYTDYLNQMVKKAEMKGVKLYFIIPPKLENYRSISGLKSLIHHERIIDVGNYNEYPQLNFVKNNFDHGHFNEQGATLFSSLLAEKIAAQLSKEPDTTSQ